MIPYERAVRFDEVDAAGILFFGCYAAYAHEAKEHLLGEIDGGYAGTITTRHVGFPVVGFECSFTAPLRYGDAALIEVSVERVGRSSATLSFRVLRRSDRARAAQMKMTFVVTDLGDFRSCPMPDDVRQVLVQHLA